jgi:hypothetical protein
VLESLARLMPIAIVGAVAPLPLAVVVTLLMSVRGLVKAVVFVGAGSVVYACVCALAFATEDVSVGSAAFRSGAVAVLLAFLGVALLGAAWVQLVRPPNAESVGTPYFDKLDQMTVRSVALFGAIITVVNVKQLSIYLVGMSTLVGSDASALQTWALAVTFMAIFQMGQLAMVGICVVAPRPASTLLARVRSWLMPHMRATSIFLGAVVGSWFLVLAAQQLRS